MSGPTTHTTGVLQVPVWWFENIFDLYVWILFFSVRYWSFLQPCKIILNNSVIKQAKEKSRVPLLQWYVAGIKKRLETISFSNHFHKVSEKNAIRWQLHSFFYYVHRGEHKSPSHSDHDTDVKLMLELKQRKLHFSQEPMFVVVRHLHVILSIKEEWNNIIFL